MSVITQSYLDGLHTTTTFLLATIITLGRGVNQSWPLLRLSTLGQPWLTPQTYLQSALIDSLKGGFLIRTLFICFQEKQFFVLFLHLHLEDFAEAFIQSDL